MLAAADSWPSPPTSAAFPGEVVPRAARVAREGPLPGGGVPGAGAGALVLLPAAPGASSTWPPTSTRRRPSPPATYDYRPAVLFVITALVLTLQEYYGGRDFYEEHLKPLAAASRGRQLAHPGRPRARSSTSRSTTSSTASPGGPSPASSATSSSRSSSGSSSSGRTASSTWACACAASCSTRGSTACCLVGGAAGVFIVSRSPDFAQLLPLLQARLALVVRPRSRGRRCTSPSSSPWRSSSAASGSRACGNTLGSGAIFAMCVPYCMIHYGKPYLEAAGAVVGGDRARLARRCARRASTRASSSTSPWPSRWISPPSPTKAGCPCRSGGSDLRWGRERPSPNARPGPLRRVAALARRAEPVLPFGCSSPRPLPRLLAKAALVLTVLGGAALLPGSASADIYAYTDDEGVIHFSNKAARRRPLSSSTSSRQGPRPPGAWQARRSCPATPRASASPATTSGSGRRRSSTRSRKS